MWHCLCTRFYNIFSISFAYETDLSFSLCRFAVVDHFVRFYFIGPSSGIYTALPKAMEVKNDESSGMCFGKFGVNRVSCVYPFQTFNPSVSLTDFPFYFVGFFSNHTQSTTCPMDSQTSYTESALRNIGIKFYIPCCDLCGVVSNIYSFFRSNVKPLLSNCFTSCE